LATNARGAHIKGGVLDVVPGDSLRGGREERGWNMDLGG